VFLKDGLLYYQSLSELLNAFDTRLLCGSPSEVVVVDAQFKYDYKFVNVQQFCNLLGTFITNNFLNSDLYVNDLIAFIKENYSETQLEKMEKIQQVALLLI
jgi:hypothetical protein